jgi:pilus assembly protein CpaF
MKLSDRIKKTPGTEPEAGTGGQRRAPTHSDPLTEFKQRVQSALYETLGAETLENITDADAMRRTVISELEQIIADEGIPLSAGEREKIAAEVSEDILGFGPIHRFLADPTVTEIMANGTDSIFIEQDGRLHQTKVRFATEYQLRRVIDRIVSQVGRRIDESSPMVDARLADGSRVNAVIPPLAVDGPALTIRKFSRDPFTADDLVELGTLTPPSADMLRICVEGRLNILITGGTGSGKTTLLNVLSSFIPEDQRIVTIEDAVELQLDQEHVVRMESRPPNIEGKGEVTARDLVRNSLRMRPDRIVVGEVRGPEALDMLQAMNTGHQGSLSTLHANSARDGLARLETMVLMAGMELPLSAIREYIASAISLVVHISRLPDGQRRVTRITEVSGMEGEIVTVQDIFLYDASADSGHGALMPTGIRPHFAQELAAVAIDLDPALFTDPTGGSRR